MQCLRRGAAAWKVSSITRAITTVISITLANTKDFLQRHHSHSRLLPISIMATAAGLGKFQVDDMVRNVVLTLRVEEAGLPHFLPPLTSFPHHW